MSYIQESLSRMGTLALEEWAMMMVDPLPHDIKVFSADGPLYCATATFRGVVTGRVTAICQVDFIETLARNVMALGPEDPIPEELRLDSLKELANVVVGNFLLDAYGPESPFELPQFETRIIESGVVPVVRAETTVFCQGDGYPLLLTLEQSQVS